MLVSKDGEVVQCGSGKSHWPFIEAGWKRWDVAVLVSVSQSIIAKLRLRYRDTHEEWNALPHVRIERLIASMRRRYTIISVYSHKVAPWV